MTHERITDWHQLALRKEAWTQLLQQSDADTFYMSFPWIASWWQHLAENYDLEAYFLYHDQQLVGILPLMRRKKEGFRQLTILGTGRSDYLDFLLHPEYARACISWFLDRILPEVAGWDMFHCTRLVEGSQTYELLAERLKTPAPFRSCVRDFDVAPYLPIVGSWETYQKEGIRKKIVQDTQRQRRRLGREFGAVSVSRATTEDEVRAWFSKLVTFHKVRRDQVKQDYSMFNEDRYTAFYRDVALRALADGSLHFTALNVEGKVAALHLGFVAKGTFYYLLPVLNGDYEKYSVGRLLLFSLLEESFERGDRRFDFGYGDEVYKYDFTAERRIMKEVVIANRTARGNAVLWWFDGLRPVLKENAFIMERLLPKLKSGGIVTETS